MFNVGRKLGLVPRDLRNPATEIERFPEVKRRRYVLPTEMPRLAAAINADVNEFAAHAIWLLLLTGIRRSEMLAAKWEDVNWKDRTLYVGKTKNGEPVLAPLSRPAIARLEQIPRIAGNPYIICGALPGKGLAYLDSMWRRVRAETGLRDLRIHDLRRTVGSWLVRDGASLHLVGAVLNHKDQKTTAGYAYFQTGDRQKALDRLGKRVMDSASGKGRRLSPKGRAASILDGTQITTRVRRFSREQLYKLAWTLPLTTLARKIGVSDVGLSKACRRHCIPVPSRGHWARASAGQAVMKTPLPPQGAGTEKTVKLRIDGRGQRRNPTPE
jgi:hypothetical protein